MNATIHTVRQYRSGILVETRNATYAFAYLRGDHIRGGGKADIEGTVTYVGDSLGKNYVNSKSLDDVPDAVVKAAAEQGTVVLENVDGGWADWNGRPEFSDTYVDIRNSRVVAG